MTVFLLDDEVIINVDFIHFIKGGIAELCKGGETRLIKSEEIDHIDAF